MNTQALELYLYMCSPEPIIKWLEENGVKTKEGALFQLKPLVQSNILSVVASQSGCLSGTESCLRHVIAHFEKLEKKSATSEFANIKEFASKIAKKLTVDDFRFLGKEGAIALIKGFGYPAAKLEGVTDKEAEELHSILISV